MKDKREKALAWVAGYTVTGVAIVIAAVVPGTTALALLTLEATMAFHIGKIYRDLFTMDDAFKVAKKIGLACVLGKIAALEALTLVPFAGWAVKAPIAGLVIQILGHEIISYFESLDEDKGGTLETIQ